MDPLHITEFASERYFSKLNQLDGNAQNAQTPSAPATASSVPHQHLIQPSTFTLPLGNPRQRELVDDALPLRPSDQKKRSLGHDLTSLRTQRRPSFAGSFGRLTSKVNVIHKTPSIVEHHEHILAVAESEGVQRRFVDPLDSYEYILTQYSITLSELFQSLPGELQEQIIAPLPIHDVLNLRLVSKAFHTLVTLNESPIARFHVAHSLPQYALRLYPLPDPKFIDLHYICGLWHRLHVASKLAAMIARQAVKEIFLRTTEAQLREFEPQHRRMRRRLMPLVFTLFHFFETYRSLHVRHLVEHGTPLNQQAFVLNPLEAQVMAMYDDQTLLKVHQAWTLVISSFSRRLRPPSYAGRLERSIKGYLKDRPADEVYTTILTIGGLRQAQRFWETKGYNARRTAVDTWYSLVTRSPVEQVPRSKVSIISHFGRKKAEKAAAAAAAESSITDSIGHEANSCNEWFCVKPSCITARRRHSTDNLVFRSSLSAGPPMSPLSREHLRLLMPDLQHLSNIWIHTAEALILERKIVERAQDIKRNSQVLMELIRDDGTDGLGDDEWWEGSIRAVAMEQEGMGASGGVSD